MKVKLLLERTQNKTLSDKKYLKNIYYKVKEDKFNMCNTKKHKLLKDC